MSKLSAIELSLKRNRNVIIVGRIREDYLGHNINWDRGYNVSYDVVPKSGLYTAEELQNFMMGLVPKGLEPTSKEDFSINDEDGKLMFGYLYFVEKIGETTITKKGLITLTDEKLIDDPDFFYKKRTFEYTAPTIPIPRNIYVNVFPSESFVKDISLRRNLKASSRFWATPEDLIRCQQI